MLVAVATVILVAFNLLIQSVRARLESFGLDTLVVREMVPPNDPELFHTVDRPDRLAPLAESGQKLRLRQLFIRAQTDWRNDLLVLAYSPEALSRLAPWLSPDSTLVCFSDSLPEFIQIRVKLHNHSGVAVVRRPPELFRPVNVENFLLVPRGWAPDVERLGFVELTLFQRQASSPPMTHFVNAVTTVYSLERRPAPQVQSALPLIRELESLQQRQTQWRRLLAAALGLTVALVFGAIAILEFRQNLFVGALLRSLGAPAHFLYLRHWAENTLIANGAALLAISLIALFHAELFGTLGFGNAVTQAGQSAYWNREIATVLLWVNVGALLSSFPVALGLRKPVGAILN